MISSGSDNYHDNRLVVVDSADQILPFLIENKTSSSAIAKGPRDALSQLKSCQLLHNCTKNHIWLGGLPFHVV